jgi:16S rRNA (cytosine967-C5)-methyltransferase
LKHGNESVSPGRLFAFTALERIEVEKAYSSYLLAASETQHLPPRERSFAHELVLGVLRHRRSLDGVIDQCVTGKNRSLHREVRSVLRLGLYQLLYMDRVPSFAAVSQTVSLCKIRIGRSPQGLVNAILRRVSSELASWREQLNQPPGRDAESLSIQYSHPTWLVDRWISQFGLQQTLAILQNNNRLPRRDFHVPQPDSLTLMDLKELTEAGHILPLDYPEDAYTLHSPAKVLLANPVFIRIEPYLHFQSRASQCIPYLLPLQTGTALLDACAAPGGKTSILAKRLGPEGKIIAMDRHAGRLLSFDSRSQGATFSNVHKVCADGLTALPFLKDFSFSGILVDAPCTGLGTLRRHPEIRWRANPDDVLRLQKVQQQLLDSLSVVVARGGYMLYSTCSTEPEENEEVICHFLRNHPQFTSLKIPGNTVRPGWLDVRGFFRTYPSFPEEDGFYAALLFRT